MSSVENGGDAVSQETRELYRSANGDRWCLVRDTGSGIPPERLAAIFDDFVTTKRRGLGLVTGVVAVSLEAAGRRGPAEALYRRLVYRAAPAA